VGVTVSAGVALGVVGASDAVGLGVTHGVGLGEASAVGLGVGGGVAPGEGVGVGLGDGVGVTGARTLRWPSSTAWSIGFTPWVAS
jgi:hypothetical protein